IETLLERYAERPEGAIVIVDQYGGAVGRVPDDATAFGHRRSAFAVIVIAMWDDPRRRRRTSRGRAAFGTRSSRTPRTPSTSTTSAPTTARTASARRTATSTTRA